MLAAACTTPDGGAVSPGATTPAASPAPSPQATGGPPTASPAPAVDPAVFELPPVPARARVTYVLRTSDAPVAEQELTVSLDPPRIALLVESARLVRTADQEVVFCSVSGEDAACVRVPDDPRRAAERLPPTVRALFTLLHMVLTGTDAAGFEPSGDEDVAGRPTTCGSADPAAFPGSSPAEPPVACVDRELGIALRVVLVGPEGQETTLEASTVEAPQPDDFSLPAEPQDPSG